MKAFFWLTAVASVAHALPGFYKSAPSEKNAVVSNLPVMSADHVVHPRLVKRVQILAQNMGLSIGSIVGGELGGSLITDLLSGIPVNMTAALHAAVEKPQTGFLNSLGEGIGAPIGATIGELLELGSNSGFVSGLLKAFGLGK